MAKMIQCPKCGKSYSSTLKVCPECGEQRLRNNKRIITILIVCAVAAAVIVGIITSFLKGSTAVEIETSGIPSSSEMQAVE